MTAEATGKRIKFKVNGREIQAAESLTIRDAFEGEKYLGVDTENATGVQSLALLMFAALRKAEPDISPEDAAEAILGIDLATEFDVEGGNGDRPPTKPSRRKSSASSRSGSIRSGSSEAEK